ncbi:hypothetical protein CEXT_467191 [Caerostris extrusa]|uniref:Uncharacterized protein n=1 Tax=Caerostris extrusa TaxID=172846 RepID=A0AAV4WFK5_CAEEX|nr:hypothetical protein CEXT_467191 [Caerostris extrusa]
MLLKGEVLLSRRVMKQLTYRIIIKGIGSRFILAVPVVIPGALFVYNPSSLIRTRDAEDSVASREELMRSENTRRGEEGIKYRSSLQDLCITPRISRYPKDHNGKKPIGKQLAPQSTS